MLISADLFCCGLVTLIQSLGFTRWFGIKLPVMMGVTFAAVGPMVAIANAMPGVDGRAPIFGAIIGAGVISMLIAPLVSRCCASSRRWSPAPSSPSSASA
jgi:uric acid transporter